MIRVCLAAGSTTHLQSEVSDYSRGHMVAYTLMMADMIYRHMYLYKYQVVVLLPVYYYNILPHRRDETGHCHS